jgi:hypothetical protein
MLELNHHLAHGTAVDLVDRSPAQRSDRVHAACTCPAPKNGYFVALPNCVLSIQPPLI